MSDRAYTFDDCCLSVGLPPEVTPVQIITPDDIDQGRATDIDHWSWLPDNFPIVIWSNGTITGGLHPR